MSELGFKRLTPENWLEPDETLKIFVRLLPSGETQPVTGTDWLNFILEPTLNPAVPDDVRKLFEVARNA
jgi:hypothetical protein